MRNERIGDYLVAQKYITPDQLDKVLAAQKEANGSKRFGDLVVELGFMSETNFAKALAAPDQERRRRYSGYFRHHRRTRHRRL